MKRLTNMQKLRKYAKWAKAEYGTDIIVSYDGKVYFRRKLISDWHKEMWEWLAEHPGKYEDDFLESRIIGKKHNGYVAMLNDNDFSFACWYNNVLNSNKEEQDDLTGDVCKNCPLCAKKDKWNCCFDLYNEWKMDTHFEDYEGVSEIAREIANLEWKWRDGNEIQ